jgi:hypothetical protein
MSSLSELEDMLLSPNKKEWTEEDKLLILKEFIRLDRKCFAGRLQKTGVKIQFMPETKSKNGTYYYKENKIILNCNKSVQNRLKTLYHEIIHLVGGKLFNPIRRGHDAWFWYAYGWLLAHGEQPLLGSLPEEISEERINSLINDY